MRQETSKAWAANGTNISTLAATQDSGSNANDAVFSGATDGSGSLAKLKAAVSDYSSTNYSAWDFVENYATTAGLTGTSYADGWYMPSIQELCKLYQVRTNVNNALNKITGATQMSTSHYWSSSQYASTSDYAWAVNFESGTLYGSAKYDTDSVCAVRAFND